MAKIAFTPSGWRSVIAEDFTFANVKVAVAAIAEYVIYSANSHKGIVVAADNRFLSDEFKRVAIELLAGMAYVCYECPLGTPAPAVAFEVVRRGAAGAVHLSAGESPAVFHGVTFLSSDGGPPAPDVFHSMDTFAGEILAADRHQAFMPYERAEESRRVVFVDPKERYLEDLRQLIDFDCMRKAGFKIVADFMHGAGAGYLDSMLREAGVEVKILRGHRDPLFGGACPRPFARNLTEACQLVKGESARLGIATGGDAARFAVIDSDGSVLSPDDVAALVLDDLLSKWSWKGSVVRTIGNTHLMDSIARERGVPLHEVPLGFTHVAEVMRREPIIVGLEESGGLTVHGQAPAMDGILGSLLVAEIVARSGKSPRTLIQELHARYGAYHSEQFEVELLAGDSAALQARLAHAPPSRIAGKGVREIIRKNGTKFLIDESEWVTIQVPDEGRAVRCFVEASTARRASELSGAARRLFFQEER